MSNVPSKSQLLIYQSDDGTIKIDVRFEKETVWLTQPLMAKLFQTTQQNISLHLQNIYEERELGLEATHKKTLSVHAKERAEYGAELLKNLSMCLTGEFGSGFDERELQQFYLSSLIRGALRPELTWTYSLPPAKQDINETIRTSTSSAMGSETAQSAQTPSKPRRHKAPQPARRRAAHAPDAPKATRRWGKKGGAA